MIKTSYNRKGFQQGRHLKLIACYRNTEQWLDPTRQPSRGILVVMAVTAQSQAVSISGIQCIKSRIVPCNDHPQEH